MDPGKVLTGVSLGRGCSGLLDMSRLGRPL